MTTEQTKDPIRSALDALKPFATSPCAAAQWPTDDDFAHLFFTYGQLRAAASAHAALSALAEQPAPDLDEIERRLAPRGEGWIDNTGPAVTARQLLAEVRRLRAENERLRYVVEPIEQSRQRAESMGRKVDEWVAHAKRSDEQLTALRALLGEARQHVQAAADAAFTWQKPPIRDLLARIDAATAGQPQGGLWAILIPGPDDVWAMASREAADDAAAKHNAAVTKHKVAEQFGLSEGAVLARVIAWPYSAGEHAEALASGEPDRFEGMYPEIPEGSPDAARCAWVEDGGPWATSCGQFFEINDGTLEDNSMKFCCYCGKPAYSVPLEEDADDAAPKEGERCTACDGTGDVHRPDGEYIGACGCGKPKEGR